MKHNPKLQYFRKLPTFPNNPGITWQEQAIANPTTISSSLLSQIHINRFVSSMFIDARLQ